MQPSVVSNKSTNIDSKLQNKTKPKAQKIVIEYETEISLYKAITQQYSNLVTDNTQSFEVKNLEVLKVRSLINVDISFIVCSNHDDPPEPMKTYYFQEV